MSAPVTKTSLLARSLMGRVTHIKKDEIKNALHTLIENEEVEAELVTAR